MTHETIAAGWLLVAAFFVASGIGIIVATRSARADRRAEQRRVHPSFGNRPEQTPVHLSPRLSPEQADALDEHWRTALAAAVEVRTPDLAAVAPVIPIQRDRRGGGQ